MGERSAVYRILGGCLREGNHLKELGVNGRIVLKLIFKKWGVGAERIDLALNRAGSRALVNAVFNLLLS
jgi:hypothetical protein